MAQFHGLLTLLVAVLGASVTVDGQTFDFNNTSWRQIDGNIRNKRQNLRNTQRINKAYQPCLAIRNQPGHCKHLSNCGDDTTRYNFPRLMDYMCIIENQFVGVCCPDYLTNDNSLRNSSPEGGLAGLLPAVAVDNEEWDETGGDRKSRRASRGCGINTRDQSRIAGGRPTNNQEWPWVAALITPDGKHFCGGTLITDRHILTAAHCIQWKKPKDLMVRLGEYDLRFRNETRALEFRVIEMRIHNRYVHSTYKNDIALLKIHRPTIFNTYIWPVCLPPIAADFTNKQATVIGWGTTSYGGAPSYILMEVNVPIWPLERCATRFTQEITSNHICAGAYDGNGDACQGDSGGPLLIQLNNGRWVNVGIVSWGIGCGVVGRPGIYTRVNTYLDWIIANAEF